MKKVRAALAAVAEKLALNKPLLGRAQRRYKANRKRAYVAHNQQVKAQGAADRLRTEGHSAKARRRDRKAARLGHVAYRNHLRAQFWLGRVKVLVARVHKLETDQEKLQAELRKFNKVTIRGNSATGGSKHERLKAVALKSAANCASGARNNFYSMPGSWDIDHCITGESYGERSDCSQWFTSVYRSAGLPDPNGERYAGGYTGTLVANGRQISRDELRPGDAVIYGGGVGHHVEMFVGPGDRTIGHGSAPVDPGVIDLFGDGDYRFFSYV